MDTALRTLDFDMTAMLGPVVVQIIKTQTAVLSEASRFSSGALNHASGNPLVVPPGRGGALRNAEEGSEVHGAGASAAPSRLQRGASGLSSLAAAAAGRTTPSAPPRAPTPLAPSNTAAAPPIAPPVAHAALVPPVPLPETTIPIPLTGAAAPAVPASAAAVVAPPPDPIAASLPSSQHLSSPAMPATAAGPPPVATLPEPLPVPFVARAEADWEAQSSDDISLLKDALVLVVQRNNGSGVGGGDDGWWQARTSDETGTVPSNFLDELRVPPPAQGRMRARFAYAPDDPAELRFEKGDELELLTPVSRAAESPAVAAVVESGWLLVRRGNVCGFAPRSYLEADS